MKSRSGRLRVEGLGAFVQDVKVAVVHVHAVPLLARQLAHHTEVLQVLQGREDRRTGETEPLNGLRGVEHGTPLE